MATILDFKMTAIQKHHDLKNIFTYVRGAVSFAARRCLIIGFAHNSKTKNDRMAKSKALPISGNPEELFFRIQRSQPS